MPGTGKIHNPRESSVGRDFRKKATAQGLKVIKIHGGPYQEKGLPDYLIRPRRTLNRFRGAGDLRMGRPCWVELKKVGGRPPEGLQLHTAAELAERGDVVIFANDSAAAVECIMAERIGEREIEWPGRGGVIDLIGIADEWLKSCGIWAVVR
jgi:hypothetical protein